MRPGVPHEARSAAGGVFLLTVLLQGAVPSELPHRDEAASRPISPDGSHLVAGVDGGE